LRRTVEADHIRNVAIIAHVDHGKTTLVDRLLYQSGMFRREELDKLAGGVLGLIMDSDPIERERGVTIFSKNCALRYRTEGGDDYRINVIDTPGHADFGGEVERVLRMADGALLLVDAFDGPMPQTRFVLSKALECGLRPIVVVNKVDRPDARPHEVAHEVLELLISLGADDASLDFPVVYASALEGHASREPEDLGGDLRPILDAIIEHVPPPKADTGGPLQMLVTTIDYSDYVGRIAIGRVFAGTLEVNTDVLVAGRGGGDSLQRASELYVFEGLGRERVTSVPAGEICAVVGLDPVDIGDTLTSPDRPAPLPPITVDEPTLDMVFRVNDGPFAGREGSHVTTREIGARLERELQSNLALRVAPGEKTDEFHVSGRGLMHLGILLENLRREGFELCAGRPKVIFKEVNGKVHEPIERLVVDCPVRCQSAVMGLVGQRRGELVGMDQRHGAEGVSHMEFRIPARGLIGLRSRMLTATQGEAVMHHVFDAYEPRKGAVPLRQSGVMVATHTGTVTGFALDALYDRGVFFVRPGEEVYAGQIVGEVGSDKDIDVNPVKAKHLNNIRSSTKEEGTRVRTPREMGLEVALEYVQDDELVEITPRAVRMRKRILDLGDRRRAIRREITGRPVS
jgi:GTP-binding protein